MNSTAKSRRKETFSEQIDDLKKVKFLLEKKQFRNLELEEHKIILTLSTLHSIYIPATSSDIHSLLVGALHHFVTFHRRPTTYVARIRVRYSYRVRIRIRNKKIL